jgi:hypothetical protein
VRLHKTDYQTKSHATEEFGFSIKGDAPVMVQHVDINSVADVSVALISFLADWNWFLYRIASLQLGGLKVGDYIVEIGEQDAKYFTQAQVLEKIRTSHNTLDLKIITPMMYAKQVYTRVASCTASKF